MSDETPEERALDQLDEVTREVAADEVDKEERREVRRRVGVLGWGLFPRMRRRGGGGDPTDERGLRDVLHERRPEE
jgi:hypothetical protein